MAKAKLGNRPLLVLLALMVATLVMAPSGALANWGGWTTFGISAASYVGGSGSADEVRGAAIAPDGSVILAANVSDPSWGGVTPILLNGATANSPGAVIRLSADGTTVLSVTRLATRVSDLAVDGSNNIYVAAMADGLIKLNPAGTSIVYIKNFGALNAWRVDAGDGGNVVALAQSSTNPDTANPGNGRLYVYNASGTQLGDFAGHRNTLDVAIDEASQTIVLVGWRQANTWEGTTTYPVQIPYIRGTQYNGTVKYTGYDWSADHTSPDWLNRAENNMADTRGVRVTIGEDGLAYFAYEVAGGNTILRYCPFDNMLQVPSVGGDQWHQFYNTKAEHKTWYSRHIPSTGAYITGQRWLTRLTSGAGNQAIPRAIHADSHGRLYVGGTSAWGLPLPTHSAYTPNAARAAFMPHGTYVGGSWLLVMSPDLTVREYTSRLTGGRLLALAVRELSPTDAQVVFGGFTNGELFTREAVQPDRAGTQDGWFAVIPTSEGDVTNTAPAASYTGTTGNNCQVQFNASATTDPDSDPLIYFWHFGDGSKRATTSANVTHTYPAAGSYWATLTVYDDRGGWSQDMKWVEATGEPVPGDPPAAPSNLTATAVSTSQINLSWTDNASDEDGFEISRSLNGTTWQVHDHVAPNVTTYQDTGLNASTTYYYRVLAWNEHGDSAFSNTANATTQGGQAPFHGTPAALPGKVEAEDYDFGGPGVAYHDTTAGNSGGQYRQEDVDIQTTSDTGGGYNVGWIANGEWLEYTVNVAQAGLYNIEVRVASPNSGRSLRIEFGGQNVTGTMSVPNTGGWQNWTTITATDVQLAAGEQIMRFQAQSDGFNVNWFHIVASVVLNPPAAPSNLTATAVSASQINLSWTDNANNEDGFEIERSLNGTTWQVHDHVAANVTTYQDTGLTAETTYWYRVRAYNNDGDSAYSNVANATTQAAPTLPAPWVNQDIGNTSPAGSAGYDNGTFTIQGAGADIWGSADAFHYVYQPLSGDGEIVARVASLQNTDGWAKAGVMIRETLAANSRHAMTVVTPSNGVSFQRRTSTGGSSTHTTHSGITAPHWVKIVRTGNLFESYRSANGTDWTFIGSATIAMNSETYIGLAVTSHKNGTLCTAVLDSVQLGGEPFTHDFLLIDDFEDHTLGAVHNQGYWVSSSASNAIAVVQDPDGTAWSTKALHSAASYSGNPDIASRWYDGAPLVAQGDTVTLFFRFRDLGTGDVNFGVTEQTTATTNWAHYKVQLGAARDGTSFQLSPRDSSGTFSHVHQTGEWFNVWLVIENVSGGSYRVYTNTGSANATENDRLSRGGVNSWAYRGGAYNGALNSILVRRNNYMVNDIYIAEGIDLVNPLGGMDWQQQMMMGGDSLDGGMTTMSAPASLEVQNLDLQDVQTIEDDQDEEVSLDDSWEVELLDNEEACEEEPSVYGW